MAMEQPQNSRLKLVAFSCDLDLESALLLWVLHIISLTQTFDQCLKKILPGVKEIWSRHHIQGSNSWPSTVTFTAELWVLHIVPLRWIFDQSLEKILPGVKEIQSTHKIQGSNPWPWTDLMSLHGWAMGSAHHFTEANIWPKLKENPSRGKGDIEWTRNSGLKLATLNCDLVLESPCLSYRFCTLSHRWTFDQSLEKIFPRNSRLKPMTLNCPWPWVGMVELLILH